MQMSTRSSTYWWCPRLSSSLLAPAENACTHDRSRRSQEMQKDRRSFLSSELLITAMFVPLRAVGVTAPSCSHPSCWSFVVDTHKSCIAVTYSVMRRHS